MYLITNVRIFREIKSNEIQIKSTYITISIIGSLKGILQFLFTKYQKSINLSRLDIGSPLFP